MHTLNVCERRLNIAKDRHDAVHRVLTAALANKYPATKGFKQRSDVVPDSLYSTSSLRPDETVYAEHLPRSDGAPNSNFALIVDVKTPFPQTGFIASVDGDNQSKYGPLRQQYEDKLGRAYLHTLIIPSTGPIPKHTYDVLKAAGINGNSVCKTLREMAIAATKANAVYASHLPTPARMSPASN
jgi:hypothetical protein